MLEDVNQCACVLQMSEEARYSIRPPRLYLEYSAVNVPRSGTDMPRVPASFGVQYVNSGAVKSEFWDAWEICMGIFLSLGFACGLLRALKWKARVLVGGCNLVPATICLVQTLDVNTCCWRVPNCRCRPRHSCTNT